MSEDDMTGRELLEFAAKAAGVVHDGVGYLSPTGLPMNWNPLNDDGDALRLAVKLRIGFTIDDEHHKVHAWSNKFSYTIKTYGTDNESVRFAIVHAAAEIGNTK